MTFSNKYSKLKELIQNELTIIENEMVSKINIREPLNSYIINFLKAPSKRVRPLLSVIFYKAIHGDIDKDQLKALSAIEIIHNASLIHDDIIDESNTRRGQKTVYAEFGNKLGVISGDYLLAIAMNMISELGCIKLIQNISNTLNKMCIGEINQNFDKFKICTINEYIEKSKNKTAYLFETALATPFIINNNKNITQASDFGINIGIAFQIRDDLLNLIKSDNLKPTKNDISEGIYNAPVIFSGSADNYAEGVEKTKDLLNNYIKKAQADIKDLPQNIYKKGLEEFLELLAND